MLNIPFLRDYNFLKNLSYIVKEASRPIEKPPVSGKVLCNRKSFEKEEGSCMPKGLATFQLPSYRN